MRRELAQMLPVNGILQVAPQGARPSMLSVQVDEQAVAVVLPCQLVAEDDQFRAIDVLDDALMVLQPLAVLVEPLLQAGTRGMRAERALEDSATYSVDGGILDFVGDRVDSVDLVTGEVDRRPEYVRLIAPEVDIVDLDSLPVA